MRRLAIVALALALSGAGAVAQQTPPRPAQDEFVPVDSLPSQDRIPAAPLVMAAYAAAWIAAFGYLWSIWRRLDRVEREIAEISRRVAPGSRR